jgi:hypothetical protein
MTDSRAVQQLLAEAAKAPTIEEARRLVGEAETLRTGLYAQAAAANDVDLAAATVAERLTPVPTYSHHTAATDWLGEVDVTPDTSEMNSAMIAQGSRWYAKTASVVKEHPEEFEQQAKGLARRLAGAYGASASEAETTFLGHVHALHDREVRTGALKVAAQPPANAAMPGPGGTFPAGNYSDALPPEATSSERAVNIQLLQQASPGSDVTPVNDPGLGQGDPTADQGNGDAATRRAASKGTPVNRRQAVSGLPQIQQTVDPHDDGAAPTPLPPEVAWPWMMDAGDGSNVNSAIQQAEQQVAEREQRKGASLQSVAQREAQKVYDRILAQGGYDASGWAGDMGMTPNGPGQQDIPGAPGSNLGAPDPVYGYGGDQGDRPIKPYGADDADDYTKNPGMNYQPGQPTQYDQGGQVMNTGGSPAPGFPNAPKTSGLNPTGDPEIAKALKFIEQRTAHLNTAGGK